MSVLGSSFVEWRKGDNYARDGSLLRSFGEGRRAEANVGWTWGGSHGWCVVLLPNKIFTLMEIRDT